MKRNIRPLLAGLFFVASCTMLSSFSKKMGGDKFEIYVNGKLLLEQFVTSGRTVQSLELKRNSSNEKIEVYYSHCGKTGTGRTITVRNAQNQVLKQWTFADASTRSPMSLQAKDILALQKNKDAKLNLYYSSKELPEGRLLAVITSNGEKTAALVKGINRDLEAMISQSILPCTSLVAFN